MSDFELNYALDGISGRPAVLLGGSLGTTLAMWQPQLPALSERFRVIRYDHRGHGGSPVMPGPYTIDELGSDVLAMLDRLEVERVFYCGLSLGGMIGTRSKSWMCFGSPSAHWQTPSS